MCDFASLVLTKNAAFWLPDSESHSEIIKRFKLHEQGARGPNIVKVEVLPPASGVIDPARLRDWSVTFDQDEFPAWHDAVESGKRAKEALAEKLVNLTTLYASYSNISDVSKLVNLTTLCAGHSNISDASKLVNLTTLCARDSKISDVSNLIRLTMLDASYSKVSNVSKLVNLTMLDARHSKISNVSKLVNLTMLDARHSKISNVSKLINLTALYASQKLMEQWRRRLQNV